MLPISLTTVATLAIRGVAFFLRAQGHTKEADDANFIADVAQAGKLSDAHMLSVAESIRGGTPANFADIRKRIQAESDRLQGAVATDAPGATPGSAPLGGGAP